MTTTTRTVYFARALLEDGWHERVRLHVDGTGTITAIETQTDRAATDAAFACALPGMPNVHSHAHQRAMAGLAEKAGARTDSFWSWRDVMYQTVRHLQPDQLYAIAAQLYVEMLKAGYTSVGEFQYLHHDCDGAPYTNVAEMSLQTLAAARSAGIGITNLPVLYCYAGFGAKAPGAGQRRFINDADSFLRIVESVQDACADDPNAATGIAPHSLRAVSTDVLREVLGGALPHNAPIHIHIAEQTQEVQECQAFCSQRPVDYLLAQVAVDARWCLIHATHMSAQEHAAVARSGAVVGVCPTTEASLGDGVFDSVMYQRNGGALAIGSDSHISVSPVEELRWLEYSQRLAHQQRNVLAGADGTSTGRTLYEWAARGGAKACGRPIGVLAVGRRADIVVPDTEHPRLWARTDDDLLDSYIFSGNAALVRHVLVGGRQVITDGHHAREHTIANDFRNTLNQLAR